MSDVDKAANFVCYVVGARLIGGDTVAQIVEHLEAECKKMAATCAVNSVSPLTMPLYVASKKAAEKLRLRC